MAVIAALDDHLHFAGRNLTLAAGSSERPPLPYEIAQVLRDALLRAADGEPDPLLKPRRVPGGRGNRSRWERRVWQERAVDYLTAVDLGLIKDRSSRKRVAETYGVGVREAQRWIKAAGTLARRRVALEKRHPRGPATSYEAWALNTAQYLRRLVEFYREIRKIRAYGLPSISGRNQRKRR